MKKVSVIFVVGLLLFSCLGTAAAQKVEITFWYALGGNSGRVFSSLVEEFNNTHSDVYVDAIYTGGYGDTAQKVMANLAGGNLPEGGLIPAPPLFTGRVGNFLIEEYMNGPDGLDKDDFYPMLWEYNMYKGRIAALPFNNSTPVLFYNKDLLKEVGLESEAPETWAELKEMSIKVRDWARDNGKQGRVWPMNMRNEDWMLKAFILQNGGHLMNADYTNALINEPEGVEAIEFWQSLVEEKLMPAGAHGQARNQFISGTVAFHYDSTAGIGSISEAVNFDFGTAFLPRNKNYAVTVGGAGLAMFPSTEEKEDATWKFLKWLLSPESTAKFAAETGYMPIRKSILESDKIQNLFTEKPYYQAGFEQMKYAQAMEQFWELGAFDDYMRELISNIEHKKMTPGEAADEFVKKLRTDIEKNAQSQQ